ncbi:hypothetical protein ACWGJ9_08165 [Curtobacterium citreum]
MGMNGDAEVREAYFRAMRTTLDRDWLRGHIPDDLHARMPLIESESSLVATVRADGHGVYDDAARALWRRLIAERVVREPTVGELMTLQEVRALGMNVPRQVKVYDVDRFHQVFPEFA